MRERVSESEWTLEYQADGYGWRLIASAAKEGEHGERVVVARPSDTAKRIAEGLREHARATYPPERVFSSWPEIAADWIEGREWGDDPRG